MKGYEEKLVRLIEQDEWRMHALRCVRALALPDSCVSAGFVRSIAWDVLHGFAEPTPLADVDVVYFDAADTSERSEKRYEAELRAMDDTIPWSVKNQARMHEKTGNLPYVSTADGIAHFTERCTAIGVYLDEEDRVRLVAPYGTEDLARLIVRPTPYYETGERSDAYRQRIEEKKWQSRWYLLTILEA